MRRSWSLQSKLGLLTAVFFVSIMANLFVSSWCIIVYLKPLLGKAEASFLLQQEIEEVRSLVRQRLHVLQQSPGQPNAADDDQVAAREEQAASPDAQRPGVSPPLSALWERVRMVLNETLPSGREIPEASADEDGEPASRAVLITRLEELDRALSEARVEVDARRRADGEAASSVHRIVVKTLVASTAIGVALCIVGWLLLRAWVVRPVVDLRDATNHLAQGELSYRVVPRQSDELGRLGHEINDMASTLGDMQTQIVEKERWIAAGNMVDRLRQAIRGPLTEIRDVADETSRRVDADERTRACQQRIVSTVERFTRWLDDLQATVSIDQPRCESCDVREILADVQAATRPALEQSHVRLSVTTDARVQQVSVDRLQFEQAVLALLTNAVEASHPGQTVRVGIDARGEPGDGWTLTVADEGCGIPAEDQYRVFQPFFTTKPQGSGVGLAMASTVFRRHGGVVSFTSEPGRGTEFRVVFNSTSTNRR